jgi:hypothetical protein
MTKNAEQLKRYRILFKSKAGDQMVTLLARNRGEAEILAAAHQARRATRYDVTHQRLAAELERGDISKEKYAAELDRRARDFSRYDIVTQKEVAKDENGEPVYMDEVAAAEAPLSVAKIEEAK